jgi:hypothetical protein
MKTTVFQSSLSAFLSQFVQYNSEQWGMLNGKTCVIELAGLRAHSYTDSKQKKQELFEPGQFGAIRTKRIAVIRDRMLTYRPELVVMYGLSEKEHWDKIAEAMEEFPPDVRRPSLTISTHPVSFDGVKNAYWEELGATLRNSRMG